MSSPPLNELISALQLLLGDLHPDSRAFVIREAFPKMVFFGDNQRSDEVLAKIASAHNSLHSAAGIFDGSSGAWHLGAATAAGYLRQATNNMRDVCKYLGIKVP